MQPECLRFSAPLLLSFDPRAPLDPVLVQDLTNHELLAVDQDPLGAIATRLDVSTPDLQVKASQRHSETLGTVCFCQTDTL